MRIDASNLLLAAQVQPQRPAAAAGNPQAPRFEPLDLPKPSALQPARQTASPGPVPRPGSQLDIKV